MKTRDLVPTDVKFEANLFVATYLESLRTEEPEHYNRAINEAMQRYVRSKAIAHFTQELYDFIQKELTCGHDTRFEFYDTMDFSLDDMTFVTNKDRHFFNKQDAACEKKPKTWKGWQEICTRVHRRLNGKIVTYQKDKFRIVKRREMLYLTKLEK